MEPEAEKLIQEAQNVNFVDVEQYPSCNDIHNRCAQLLMIALLADTAMLCTSCNSMSAKAS